MNIKIFCVLSVLVLFVSCKKNEETTTIDTEKKQNQVVTVQDITKLKYIEYTLDSKTETSIKDWQEYFQLQDVITNTINADLSFFNDNEDTVKTLVTDLEKSIPSQVNSEAIFARMLVLETKIFKLESLSNLPTTGKEELLNTIKELLISFSNFNFQMNKKIEFDNRTIEKP